MVHSSNGELKVNSKTGKVIKCDMSTDGEGIDQIERFDIEEYKKFWNAEITDDIDILNLGYWTKDGQYEEPADDWRKDLIERTGQGENKTNTPVDSAERFEVATFDSDTSGAIVIEGDLSWDKSLEMATELWLSGNYYGVEIVSLDHESLDPIKWIRTKSEFIESF